MNFEGDKDDSKDIDESKDVYRKIQPMIEQRRKLVQTESKRLRDLSQNLTIEQAMGIIHLLAGIVKRHVTDPKQLEAIATELTEAVAR